METSGPYSEVAKLMPPLTIEMNTLAEGLGIFESSIKQLARGEVVMIVKHLEEIVDTKDDIDTTTWNSRRLLLTKDGMGFSLNDTLIKAGTETLIWYKNHVEAVYCIEGEGKSRLSG